MKDTSRRAFLSGLTGLGLIGLAGRADAADDVLTDEDRAAFGAGPLMPARPHPLNTRIPANATTTGLGLKFEVNPPPIGGHKLTVSGQIFVPSFTYFVPGQVTMYGRQYARLETRTFPGAFASVSRMTIVSRGAFMVVLDRITLPSVPSMLDISLYLNRASAPRSVLATIRQHQTRYDYPSVAEMRPADLKSTGTRLVELGGAFLYRATS